MICQCCGRLFAQMLTKKYCQKCKVIGPRKELEKRSADRLYELKKKYFTEGMSTLAAVVGDVAFIRKRKNSLVMAAMLGNIPMEELRNQLFDAIADKILRREGLLPIDEIPIVRVHLQGIDELEKMGRWPATKNPL